MDHPEEKLRRFELQVFVVATFSVALVHSQQLRIPSPWLDANPHVIELCARNLFGAFFFASVLPCVLSTSFVLPPLTAGRVVPREPAFVSVS